MVICIKIIYCYNRTVDEDKKHILQTHSYYLNIIESYKGDNIYCISTNSKLSCNDFITSNNIYDYIIKLELPIKTELIEQSLIKIDQLVFHHNFTNQDLQLKLSNLGYFTDNTLLEGQQINCALEFRFNQNYYTYDPNHFLVYGYINHDIKSIIIFIIYIFIIR